MTRRLEGKRTVVTGAANGLALACATRFVEDGGRVVLSDIDIAVGEAASSGLADDMGNAIFASCDVTRREDLDRSIDLCVAQWGGIDVLVNNADVAILGDIMPIGEATFDKVIAISLKSAFHGTQLASRRMINQGTGGVTINMSSINAVLNIPQMLAYSVPKGGFNQLTRNTAVALAFHGIRVCGIGPGTIMTELTRQAVWNEEFKRRFILSRTPIRRVGEPREIASIASFLALDDASHVTGETVYADGGRLGLNYTVEVGS